MCTMPVKYLNLTNQDGINIGAFKRDTALHC